ncbi:hypothetical protein A3I34_00570 [Candidatus Jorgensenbacteria bacterium RIFCSPLOWO2_02_FULL_45_12]|nr:MAG: hypothetical protein A3D55_00690 [Candidatus Jorgensenbacteria bacterium RIFCSPHIGHO2_02_FULL_45_20]OGG42548.1 MAG: hypothetical protein A3I34_00570 [Candidatus Jorgensenbacteria bacterium RIFCSPLOWO2_02_FULL_45_12]
MGFLAIASFFLSVFFCLTKDIKAGMWMQVMVIVATSALFLANIHTIYGGSSLVVSVPLSWMPILAWHRFQKIKSVIDLIKIEIVAMEILERIKSLGGDMKNTTETTSNHDQLALDLEE